MSKRAFSDEVEILIAQKYLGGRSIFELADEFEVHYTTISNVLGRRGVKARGMRKIDEATGDLIAQRYLDGETTVELAAEFGVTDVTIGNVLRRRGVRAMRNVHSLPEVVAQMVVLYDEGLSLKKVAERVQVGITGVRKALLRAGVELRPRRKYRLLTEAQVSEAAEMYGDGTGKTLEELGKHFGVSIPTVAKALDDAGVERRVGWRKYRVTVWADRKGRTHRFRSTWEMAYAKYMDDLGIDWDFEPVRFRLPTCQFYTPDFRVLYDDGAVRYIEVKGWLDEKSMARMLEFVREYPEVDLAIVGPSELVDLGLIDEEFSCHHMAEKVSRFSDQLRLPIKNAGIGLVHEVG